MSSGLRFAGLAHTYSIVAYDAAAQQFGVAVQSHYIATGSAVPWLQAGVGAVATQSWVEISYGPLGLALMEDGKSAQQALAGLLAADPEADQRQVAMIDRHGIAAIHTGRRCIPAAGHRTGEGYSVQANMMLRDTVWDAMAEAYEGTSGDLAQRMLASLEAAEAEGGDIRGRQSAALAVVTAQPVGSAWRGRIYDLRVDDHVDPLVELRRLLSTARACQQWNAAEALLNGDSIDESRVRQAIATFQQAPNTMPANPEGVFWFACALVNAGYGETALPYFRQAFYAQPLWRELAARLPAVGLLHADDNLLHRIVTL